MAHTSPLGSVIGYDLILFHFKPCFRPVTGCTPVLADELSVFVSVFELRHGKVLHIYATHNSFTAFTADGTGTGFVHSL